MGTKTILLASFNILFSLSVFAQQSSQDKTAKLEQKKAELKKELCLVNSDLVNIEINELSNFLMKAKPSFENFLKKPEALRFLTDLQVGKVNIINFSELSDSHKTILNLIGLPLDKYKNFRHSIEITKPRDLLARIDIKEPVTESNDGNLYMITIDSNKKLNISILLGTVRSTLVIDEPAANGYCKTPKTKNPVEVRYNSILCNYSIEDYYQELRASCN